MFTLVMAKSNQYIFGLRPLSKDELPLCVLELEEGNRFYTDILRSGDIAPIFQDQALLKTVND